MSLVRAKYTVTGKNIRESLRQKRKKQQSVNNIPQTSERTGKSRYKTQRKIAAITVNEREMKKAYY